MLIKFFWMMSGDGSDNGNWLALLKWSLANTDDGTRETSSEQMSAENVAFLENAMKQMKSVPDRMREIMETLVLYLDEDKSDGVEPEKDTRDDRNDITEALLDELLDFIEDIDFAQIFVKFGGAKSLLLTAKAIGKVSVSNRASCLSVLGSLAQNNLVVQDTLFQDGTLPQLISFYPSADARDDSNDEDNEKVWAKSLFAISSIVRNHATAEVTFIQNYANLVFSEMNRFSNAIKRRCVYLAISLLGNAPSRAAQIAALFVPSAYAFIADPSDVDLREGSLQLLQHLARTSIGRDALGGLKSALDERNAVISSSEDHDDTHELGLISTLLDSLTNSVVTDTSEVIEPRGEEDMIHVHDERSGETKETEESSQSPVLMIAGGTTLVGAPSAP